MNTRKLVPRTVKNRWDILGQYKHDNGLILFTTIINIFLKYRIKFLEDWLGTAKGQPFSWLGAPTSLQ